MNVLETMDVNKAEINRMHQKKLLLHLHQTLKNAEEENSESRLKIQKFIQVISMLTAGIHKSNITPDEIVEKDGGNSVEQCTKAFIEENEAVREGLLGILESFNKNKGNP